MQVLNNIYQVLGGSYANIANIFVIKAGNELVLIDSAETEEEYEIILENIKYWGLEQYPISYLLLSHKHLNHIGNAYRFREMGAGIVAGAMDAQAIEQGIMTEICDFAPFPKKKPYTPCPIDVKAKEGDIIRAGNLSFEVIEVPGHTDGSVFYRLEMDGKVIYFTGDVLNVDHDCSGALLGWEGGKDYNRDKFFESVKRFSKFKCDIILPGHYQLCLQDGSRIMNDAYRAVLTEWRKPAIVTE